MNGEIKLQMHRVYNYIGPTIDILRMMCSNYNLAVVKYIISMYVNCIHEPIFFLTYAH